jgi:hypothetical protein
VLGRDRSPPCSGRRSTNPHIHMVALDGTWYEEGAELAFEALGHLKTSEVGEVLERTVRRIDRHLRRRGLVRIDDDVYDAGSEGDPESNLAASAVSGQAPPAGPQWLRGLNPLEPQGLAYDKPLCASLDGFTLHAATVGARGTSRRRLVPCLVRTSSRERRSGVRSSNLPRSVSTYGFQQYPGGSGRHC